MKHWPSFLAFLLLVVFWSFLVRTSVVPSYLLPGPEQVLISLQEMPSDYWQAFQGTFKSTFVGFAASSLVGFSLALLLVSFDFLKRAFLPFAVFFQTVPIVAIAPLMVIWFGFGEKTVQASAFIVSLFPVLASSLAGLSGADPRLKELFKAYGASKSKQLFSLQIPSSLPLVFAGLQISAGLSVIGAIVGEFVAGGGLGGLIDSARTQQRVDIVFAALFLSSLMGLLFVSAIRSASRLLLKWRPFFSAETF